MPTRNRSQDGTAERTALIAAAAAHRSTLRLLVPLQARQRGMAVHPAMRTRRPRAEDGRLEPTFILRG